MSAIKWPTAQDVVDAYAKTGWKPVRSTCWQLDEAGRDCGCAAGVLEAAMGVRQDSAWGYVEASICRWGPAFVRGLMTGFDGLSDARCAVREDSDWQAGHAVGKAAMKLVVPGEWW